MNRPSDVRREIESVIRQLLDETGRASKPLADEEQLFGKIGLDSLDLAQVVVILEQRFGVDPFRKAGVVVQTFGELTQAYIEAFEQKAEPNVGSSD